MELTHTHRTNQIRNDYELAALDLMRQGRVPESSIDQLEEEYRGREEYEKTVRFLSVWLKNFRPGFTAKPHACKGQGCS